MRTGMIYAAALAISSCFNFVALLTWTRVLNPSDFGVYALASGTALFLNALVFEWLRLAAARTLVDPAAQRGVSDARANAIALITIAVTLLFGFAAALAWALRMPIGVLSWRWWLIIAGFTVTEMALALANTVSRFRMLPWQFFRSMAARGPLSLAIGLLLVVIGHFGPGGAIAGIVIAQALIVMGALLLDPFWRAIRPFSAKRSEIKAILHFGTPLIVSSSAGFANGFADRYIAGQMLGLRAVGLYSAPFDVMQKTIAFLLMAINLTSYPEVVHAQEKSGPEASSKLLGNNLLLQTALCAPALGGLAALSPGLSNLLLGPAFRDSALVLMPIIAAAVIFRSLLNYHVNIAFQLARRTRLMLVGPLLGVGVLVIGCYAAAPRWGIKGVAVAALIAQILAYGLGLILANRVFPMRVPMRDLVRILSAAAVMALVLSFFRGFDGKVQTVLLVAIGSLIYAAALFASGFGPARQIGHSCLRRLHVRGFN